MALRAPWGLISRDADPAARWGGSLLAHRQICAVLLCMLFMSLACAAPDASPRFGLSIRAGLALDEALQELARQSGVQLVFFSQITTGRSAPQLSGEYTLAAAMTRLLEGSDLTFRQVNEHTVEVRQAPPRSGRLPLEARQSTPTPASDDPMQEVHVIAKVEQLVATRIPTPLQEIPQSVSVISHEQIRQQNSFELGDLLQNTPGIAVRRANSMDASAFSRTNEVLSYQVDAGGPLKPWITGQILYYGTPDLSEFDRVEVLRGSDALFSGDSNPGGTVSLVRKRPLSVPSFGMSATLGSWNNYRIELDATGPLTDDGALRGRADVVYAKRDYFFDRAHQDRKNVFGVVEYDFTPMSTLTAGGSYQWDDALPLAGGLPLYSDGRDSHLPRNTALTFDWAFYNTRAGRVYLQYRQQFADDWVLKLNTSVARTIVDYGWGAFGSVIDTRTQSLGSPSATFSIRPDRFTVGSMDATLTGKLDWFGMRETIAIGGDFSRIRSWQSAEAYLGSGPPLTNILAFDPKRYPDPRETQAPLLGLEVQQVQEQYGGFVSLQVDVTDALSITGGGRVASDSLRLGGTVWIGSLYFPGLSNEYADPHVFQPYGALMYRISDHLSWYASYADVYRALRPEARRSDGTLLGPMHGVTLESGIKGAWRGGSLNASLAVYQFEERHEAISTAERSELPGCCYVSRTGRGRGAELDVDGEIAPRWLIGSGYAYSTYESADGSIPQTSTPRHLLKIWTSVTLPGAFSRWTVGGGLHAQAGARGSAFYARDAGSQTLSLHEARAIRPYAVIDLRAGFELDSNWQVALSVNNVLDKRYYLSQDTPFFDVWYGDPRNLMLRIDAKF
jgi:outer membrane receptor for ferric coprogen and ferric-rhodotorulic acid